MSTKPTILTTTILPYPTTTLGESPLYRASDHTLHYIDVQQATIHIISLPHRKKDKNHLLQHRSITCPEPIASINFSHSPRGYLVCTYTGLAILSENDGHWTPLLEIIPPQDQDKVRLNDSAVDCHGRLWVGSLDRVLDGSTHPRPHIPTNYNNNPLGSLYRYDPDTSTLHTIISGGLVCSNGIGWTPDYRTMFHTDSFRQVIWAYEYAPETGEIDPQRRVVHVDRTGQEGEPDGLVVDSAGNLFTFIWGGGAVEKYDGAGRLVRRWCLGVRNVTHGAWVRMDGGEEEEAEDGLVVTTAVGEQSDGDGDQDGRLFWVSGTESKGMGRGVFGLSVRDN